MKKLAYLIPLLLSACSPSMEEVENIFQPTATEPMAYINVPDTSQAVTMEAVEHIAKIFNGETPATRTANNKEIENIETVTAEDGTPQMYIINYKNQQGFLILSATKDYEPVLAYSEKGSFHTDAANETGASIWMDEQKQLIASAQNFPDSVKYKYRTQWSAYTAQKKPLATTRAYEDVIALVNNQVNQWISEGHTVYFVSDYIQTPEFQSLPQDIQQKIQTLPMGYANPNYGGRDMVSFIVIEHNSTSQNISPLLSTTWDQDDGYNGAVPNGTYLGCSTVAIAQVMKYHKHPANYEWHKMANNEPNPENEIFLYLVGQTIGLDYANGDYSANLYQMMAALEEFGYSNTSVTNHNVQTCKNQLALYQPVIMTGQNSVEGHAWICDGYKSSYSDTQLYLRVLEDCPVDYEPQNFLEILNYRISMASSEYLHMNWGWGGYSNGYYTDGNLKAQNGNYQKDYLSNRQDIINIYPVD